MNSQLTEYISHNVSLGYDINAIKESLLAAGYEISQINAAIDYVMAQGGSSGQARKIDLTHPSKKTVGLIVIVAIFLLVLAGVGIFLMQLPDLTPTTPGIAKEPTQTYTPPTVSQPTQPQIDEPAAQEVDDPVFEEPSSQQFDPLADTSPMFEARLSRIEIDEKVDSLSQDDPDEALKLCKQIIPRGGQNNCITKVSFESENPRLCELIKDDPAKDTCYINFAINEIASSEICRNIINEFKRASCYDLYRNLAELEQLQKSEPTQPAPINETQIEDAFTANAFT